MAMQLATVEGLALSRSNLPAINEIECPFDLSAFRVFDTIPEHHHGIVALNGAVVVYETDTLYREEVQDGGFYVVENQHPPAGMRLSSWLEGEREDSERRAQPRSRLTVARRVVQLVRHPTMQGHWIQRQSSGFSDGPYPDWSVGFNLVGKVVGVFAPDYGRENA